MILLRQRLFSDKKESKKEKEKTIEPAVAGLGAVALTSDRVIPRLWKIPAKGMRKSNDTITKKLRGENKELYDKLIKEAKDQGTKVVTDPRDMSRASLKPLRDMINNDEKLNNLPEEQKRKLKGSFNKFMRQWEKKRTRNIENAGDCYLKGIDTVYVEGNNGSAAILSHELGHSKHSYGREGGKIGKIAHKAGRLWQPAATAATGFASGYKAEKDKEKGKKVSTLNKLTPAIVGAGTYVPILVAEGAASKQGLKTLKKLGASENYLKASKKQLNSALGTYVVAGAGRNVLLGYGSREAGKLARKMDKKKEDKKADKK